MPVSLLPPLVLLFALTFAQLAVLIFEALSLSMSDQMPVPIYKLIFASLTVPHFVKPLWVAIKFPIVSLFVMPFTLLLIDALCHAVYADTLALVFGERTDTRIFGFLYVDQIDFWNSSHLNADRADTCTSNDKKWLPPVKPFANSVLKSQSSAAYCPSSQSSAALLPQSQSNAVVLPSLQSGAASQPSLKSSAAFLH